MISFGYILDKKTQTTKDLAKPWAHIPSLIPNQSRPEKLNLNSNVDATDKDNHPSTATTTLSSNHYPNGQLS